MAQAETNPIPGSLPGIHQEPESGFITLHSNECRRGIRITEINPEDKTSSRLDQRRDIVNSTYRQAPIPSQRFRRCTRLVGREFTRLWKEMSLANAHAGI